MRPAALIAVLLLIGCRAAAGTPTTGPTSRPFAIWSDERGQLQLTIRESGPANRWYITDAGGLRYETHGAEWCYLSIDRTARGIELCGSRWPVMNWTASTFRLIQEPGRCHVEIIIRTPAGMPDWTLEADRRHTAEAVEIDGVRPFLNELLAELGQPPYDPGEYLDAIRRKATPPGWVTVKVESALELLAARSPRLRQMGADEIEAIGWPGALCLRRMDLRGMTCEQRRAVECLLAEWPKGE